MKLVPISLHCIDALYDFETENKNWFEQWVPARPAAYESKESLGNLLGTQVEEMNAGGDLLYLLMDDGNVVGRFNLVVNGKSAEVGYRISARYLGEGLATLGLGELIQQAKNHGIKKLTAVTMFENIASTVVLKKLDFVKVGVQKQAAELHGKKVDLIEFERVL